MVWELSKLVADAAYFARRFRIRPRSRIGLEEPAGTVRYGGSPPQHPVPLHHLEPGPPSYIRSRARAGRRREAERPVFRRFLRSGLWPFEPANLRLVAAK